jgi:hypothetical protein
MVGHIVEYSGTHPYSEVPLAKPNYHHARRQKELARKTKQQEKQQKRAAAREPTATDNVEPTAALDGVAPQDPNSLSSK